MSGGLASLSSFRVVGGPIVAYRGSTSSTGLGVDLLPRYSLLCPYTLSRVESEVFELNGLDSLEELEHTLAGQGDLPGAREEAPTGPGVPSNLRFDSGFWAISEKY